MAVDFILPQGGFGKRKTLRDQLDRLAAVDDDDEEDAYRARLEEIETLYADIEAAKTHRWHAPRTQNRQDAHLQLYKQFVLGVWNGREDWETVEEAEWRKELFPLDFDDMVHKMQLFITWVFKRAAPRSRAANVLDVRTICQYRDSLLFWAGHYLSIEDRNLPRARLFNKLVRQIRYTKSRYGEGMQKVEKTWLGLAELRQLLDNEALSNRCVELSEQHQLLWCIGRITALRPGSLCPGTHYARTKPLTWASFRFFQGDGKGAFRSEVTIDHINIKRVEDPTRAFEQDLQTHPLTLKFPAPSASNFVFSPTHRLLVIALRRGILEGIETVDDLFNSDKHEIFIKEQHKNDVMFYRGRAKGDALDKPHPLSAEALTSYLKRRGRQIGYTKDITWYSIRRRTATDMVFKSDMQTARFLLGHSPDSHTLERYYLNWTQTLDNMGLLTEEGVKNKGKASADYGWAPLAMERLENDAYQRSRGRALNHLITRMILADENAPDVAANSAAMKNYRRRVKNVAEKILVERENEWQRRQLTKEDVDKRRAELKASTFADEVLQHAKAGITRLGDAIPTNLNEESRDLCTEAEEEGFLSVAPDQAAHEPDLEDEFASRTSPLDHEDIAQNGLEMQFDNEMEVEPYGEDVTYELLAKSAMMLWLENRLSTHATWSARQQTCPLCQDDATADQTHKDKRYRSEAHLQDHIDGNYHHPGMVWRRRMDEHFLQGWQYSCPYCVQSNAEIVCKSSGRRISPIIDHILESDEATTSRLHNQLKADDGWYSPEWQDPRTIGPTQSTLDKAAQAGRKRLLQSYNIDTTPLRVQPTPIPAPGETEIVAGGPFPKISARYNATIQPGNNTGLESGAVPLHLADVIETGFNPDLLTIPPELKDAIEFVDTRRRR